MQIKSKPKLSDFLFIFAYFIRWIEFLESIKNDEL
jgi:hypothetical protein